MTLFAANLNLALTRARGVLRAEPRVLSTITALAVVLFLMLWAPVVGRYLLTDGYRLPVPPTVPLLYGLAIQVVLPLFYLYGLAFLLAGATGYLVERSAGAPLYPPERGIERYGLRYAHQLLPAFIAGGFLLQLADTMLFWRPGADGQTLEYNVTTGGLVLLIALQLAGQLFLVLWTLELVRGRGWTKAGFAAAVEGLKKPEVLLVGLGYLALEIVALVATGVVLEPAEVATPVTGLPFALLLVLARAALLPLVLLLLMQWQPAAADAPESKPSPAENPLAAAAESAPAPAAKKSRRQDRKRR